MSNKAQQGEECVILSFKLNDGEFGSFDEREAAFALEDQLENATTASHYIEYDGHEFGGGWCKFYFYGSSAKLMSAGLLSILRTISIPKGSFLSQRFGPPGAKEQNVPL